MVCTVAPEAFLAAAIPDNGMGTIESMERVSGDADKLQFESAAETEPMETESFRSSESVEKEAGISTASFVEDDYTFLTLGDPLDRTGVTSNEIFAFQPEVSGWYHVKADSIPIWQSMRRVCILWTGKKK